MNISDGIGLVPFLWDKLTRPIKWVWVKIKSSICRDLYKENENLLEIINSEKYMVHDEIQNVYYFIKDGIKDGPFCPTCWDSAKRKARFGPFGYDKKCNVCDKVVGNRNEEESKRQNNDENWFS